MGKTYEEIDARLRTFIEAQAVFFVATAPLAADGHVNLSPKGRDLDPPHADFETLRARFPEGPIGRAIVEVEATRISDSCGYGVPLYAFEKERSQLVDWAERKEEAELRAYQRKKNARSLDGLPAVTWLDPRGEEADT